MAYIGGPKLAAAVSNAGGLGVVGPFAGVSTAPSGGNLSIVGERTRQQIEATRSFTDKPFAINVMVGRTRWVDRTERSLEVCREERLPLVYLSYNEYDSPSPEPYIKKAKDSGAKVLLRSANCTSEMARRLEAAGVDVLVIAGYDAGGHSGYNKIPTLTLVPYIVDAVQIPVVAGGGIGDARGIAAVLALGADGVLIGSRFIPTYSGPDGEGRALRNKLLEHVLSLQTRGASWEEIERAIYSGQVRTGLVDGDVEWGAIFVSPGAGMAKTITSAEEAMTSLVAGYEDIVNRLK